jgi:hypothetical protein
MADIHGSPGSAPQMPAAPGPGPAPAPYGGPELQPEPPDYAVPAGPYGPDGAVDEVISFPGAALTLPHPGAYDIAAGLADAPYSPGPLVPVNAAGDPDPGGRDVVASGVAAAVHAAEARIAEFQSDTYGQGSTYGDLMHFPPSPLDPGAGVGNTSPAGGFYDPDRDYGGAQGAPGYEGKAQ